LQVDAREEVWVGICRWIRVGRMRLNQDPTEPVCNLSTQINGSDLIWPSLSSGRQISIGRSKTVVVEPVRHIKSQPSLRRSMAINPSPSPCPRCRRRRPYRGRPPAGVRRVSTLGSQTNHQTVLYKADIRTN
jgi:hypothetical protein